MQAEITCDELANRLAGSIDRTDELTLHERRHAESCLRCQADLVKYRKILRTLRSMRSDLLDPPDGSLAQVLAAIEDEVERRNGSSGRTVVYLGGLAAATAAAGAAGAILAARSRRLRPAS